MAPQKETLMVLKVDLECHRCYTKVKRLLCCYPQIMDQIYNEKQNTVTIKVVCCSPDKIMDKLLSRGGKSIKAIQILEPKNPPPPKDAAADKPKPPPADKPPKQAAPADKPPKQAAPADKPPKQAAPADKPKDAEKPPQKVNKSASKNGADAPPAKPADATPAKPKGDAAPAAAAPPKPAEQAAAMMHMMPPELIHYYPGYPANAYDGRMTYHGNGYGYGAPPPPPPPAGGWGYYGPAPPPPPPGGYGYGYKPVNQYGDYISDENATGCVVM